MFVCRIDVITVPNPNYFGINFCTSPPGILQLFQYNHPCSFTENRAPGIGVERPARRGRAAVVFAGSPFKQALANHNYRIDLCFSPAGQGDVSVAAGDNLRRFAYRQMRSRFSTCDSVARPLYVVNNTYMAGEHIGQIFQQP